MSVKWEVKNIASIKTDLRKFAKDVRTSITDDLDAVLDKEIDRLKSKLKYILNRQVTIGSQLGGTNAKLPENLNIPKVRSDILKEVFNADVMASDYMQKALKNKVVNDNSNVFVFDKGRIKAWQSVTDSSTYASQESFFRNRLMEGVIIDAQSGEIHKINPQTVKGTKLECSRDTGQTIDSEKKFEAYKNAESISRRKNDAPYDRVAVWSMRQEDANYLMKTALPMNQMFELIETGDYDTALQVLTANNKGGAFNQAIDKLTNFKKSTAAPNMQTHAKIVAAINSLKAKKTVSQHGTTYTLLSTSYDSDVDTQEDFVMAMRREIQMWKLADEQMLITTIINAINKVIARYNKG